MRVSRVMAIAGHDARLFRHDPSILVLFIGIPLALMAFLRPSFEPLLASAGSPQANGAEQAVPGMAVMFAFFVVTFVGFGFFREHGWNTWARLRATPVRPLELVSGKCLLGVVLATVQFSVLFGVGRVVLGLRIRGSLPALVAVLATFVLLLVVAGVALTAVCRTIEQFAAASALGAVILSALGGAIVPYATLPGWAKAAAPASPAYWVMDAVHDVVLEAATFADIAKNLLVLAGMTLGLVVLAVTQFRSDAAKTSWG